MEELFRYQQLRQSQKLSEEQKRLIGLPLYPDDNYSPLANKLIDINKARNDNGSVASQLEEYSRTAKPIEDPANIRPAIRAVYDWLNFKAKPIKTADFADFVLSLNPLETFDLEKEWITYADNLVIAIYQGNISINYCVDFQLLIRICYLFKYCIVVKDGKVQMKEGTSAALLDAILVQPVLLPPLILISRCSGDCRKKGKVELPRVPVVPEGRGENPANANAMNPARNQAATAFASIPTLPIFLSSKKTSLGMRKETLPTLRTFWQAK